MKTRNIAAALVALMGLSSYAVQSASASDLSRVLGSLTGYRSGGYINSGNQAQIRSNISLGMNNLQNSISQAIAAGQLDSVEQANLRAQLNRIEDMDNSFSADGVYSQSEVSQLLSEFTNMNNSLSVAISTSAGGSIGSRYGNGYGNSYNYGRTYSNINSGIGYGNLSNMRTRISADISTALANGRISRYQANRMRNELNTLSYRMNTSMTVSQRRDLMNRLNSLQSQLAGSSRFY
jgi:hypothetical protein